MGEKMKENKQLTPWHDEEGEIHFPYRAILDRAFIFQIPPPERFGEEKLIEIPEQFRKYYKKGEGILLSIGPGYYSNEGKWHPTSDQLKPGTRVYYDKTVPWGCHVEGLDGKEYGVVICGYKDIQGIVEDELGLFD